MKKDVLIEIKGTYRQEEDADSVEVMTTGSFYKRKGDYYIVYEETEATGLKGVRTILRVEPAGRVTMKRMGADQTQLIVERGVRHQCCYDTGCGTMTIGVSGGRVVTDLCDAGGSVEFDYSLDVDTFLASENSVRINVTEQTI